MSVRDQDDVNKSMYRKAHCEVSGSEAICHPWNAGWLQVHHFTLSGGTSVHIEGVLLIKKFSVFLNLSFQKISNSSKY